MLIIKYILITVLSMNLGCTDTDSLSTSEPISAIYRYQINRIANHVSCSTWPQKSEVSWELKVTL